MADLKLHPVYQDLREKWKHEDELVHQRVTRLLTTQAFFLSAHGVLIALRADVAKRCNIEMPTLLCGIKLNPMILAGVSLPVIGVFLCIHAWIGINAAFQAMQTLKEQPRLAADGYFFPNVEVREDHTRGGQDSTRYIPLTFMVCWFGIAVYEVACWFD